MVRQASNSRQEKPTESIPAWPNFLAGAVLSAKDNWGRSVDGLRAKEFSLVMHLLLASLILFPVFNSYMKPGPGKPPSTPIFYPGFSEIRVPKGDGQLKGGGSGGARENDPARQGGLPLFTWLQKTPPGIIRNTNPKLPAEETIVGPPEIIPAPATQFGNPFSRDDTNSQGLGGGNGFGERCCGGSGPGNGRGGGEGEDWGIGGIGRPQMAGRNNVGYPECIYCPTPSFSEEARKSKLQGAVTLRIVVGSDGRAANIRVVRGLGMGLDERATDAVRAWRFKPALGPGGKPVPTEVLIEVTFRLL